MMLARFHCRLPDCPTARRVLWIRAARPGPSGHPASPGDEASALEALRSFHRWIEQQPPGDPKQVSESREREVALRMTCSAFPESGTAADAQIWKHWGSTWFNKIDMELVSR